MIVTPSGDQLFVVTQNDHAHFAGELLSLWRGDGLPEHPHRRELLFAAREHDNGWREVDSAPLCRSPDGRPHDFMSIPRQLRQQIWDRGTARFARREPYAGLLIVRHALRLHRAHRDDPDWTDALERWGELEAGLVEATGATEAIIAGDDRWVDLADRLSLQVCNRWTEDFEAHGFTASVEPSSAHGATLTLDPFPLAGTTTLHVACRLIPDRRYRGDADLGVELAAARWRRAAVRVAPRGASPGKAV